MITVAKLNKLDKTNLNLGAVVNRVDRHYCKRVKQIQMCTMNCLQDCHKGLERILRPIVKARDPYAIITWRCRDAAETMAENTKEVVLNKNWLGEQVEANPFEILEDVYESKTA